MYRNHKYVQCKSKQIRYLPTKDKKEKCNKRSNCEDQEDSSGKEYIPEYDMFMTLSL